MPGVPRDGYDPDFLGNGYHLPLPEVSLELDDDLVRTDDGEHVFDYVHYSVVMSKFNRQAFFSAANFDQANYRSVTGRNWFVDQRIGAENQIGPLAYERNPWDRGHLTKRTAITWGASDYVAKRASNDSCSYANASMQHENFNQDEWRAPEKVVRHFKRDKNDRLSVFTGPIFTETDRYYTKPGIAPVRIPSGFFKVIAYIDKDTDELASQAYVMYQDPPLLRDDDGTRDSNFDVSNYQVAVTVVERLTGIEFPEPLYETNPLRFHARENENSGPERFRAPRSSNPEELATDVVRTRADVERLADRYHELKMEDFESLMRAPVVSDEL